MYLPIKLLKLHQNLKEQFVSTGENIFQNPVIMENEINIYMTIKTKQNCLKSATEKSKLAIKLHKNDIYDLKHLNLCLWQ